jgi:hypothetical protein
MAVRIPIISDFADKGIKEAEKQFGKLGKTGVAIGAIFAASSAAVVTAMTKSIFAAAEDQRSQELLAKQLENTVGASDKTTKATEDFIGKMELASGVADDVLMLCDDRVESVAAVGADTEVALATMSVGLRTWRPLLVMPHHEYGQIS